MYKEEFLYNPIILNSADFGNATGFKLLLASRLENSDSERDRYWCENRVRYNFNQNYYEIEKTEYLSQASYNYEVGYISYWYFFTQETTINGKTFSAGIWKSETYSVHAIIAGTETLVREPLYKKTKWKEGSTDLYTAFGYFYFDLENMITLANGMRVQDHYKDCSTFDAFGADEFNNYSTITEYDVGKTFLYTQGVTTTDYPDLVRELLSGSQYGSISELLNDIALAVQELKGNNTRKILGNMLPYEIRKYAMENK